LTGIGCATRKPAPAPDLTDRPSDLAYLRVVRIDEDVFRAPSGQIRVFSTTRPVLDAMRRPGDGGDFDNSARPLFYMGSDADWDYYYLADHAFGLFYRARREFNSQDERMALTGNSLAWREVTATVGVTTTPDAGTTRP
jgi:hypothetical protein